MDAVRAVMQLLEDLKNANEELDRKVFEKTNKFSQILLLLIMNKES